MKKILMVLTAVTLLIGLTTTTHAFSAGDNYSIANSEVKFYLVDWDQTQFNNQVIMTASTLGTFSTGNTGLQYSLDGSSWLNFTSISSYAGTATIAISPSNHTQIMYLKYASDTIADNMMFQSWTVNSGSNTTPANLDIFTGLVVNFDITKPLEITFASNTANDKFAPVPIPPTVWLLGSGLLGLIGIRRRFRK